MEKLMCTVGVEGPARAYADAFVGAEHRSVPNVAAEIAQATAAIYSELTQIAAGHLD